MNRVFKLLAPDRIVGAVAVALVLMCCVALLNVAFVYFIWGGLTRALSAYVLQAICVGGPFVAFFCVVTNFQLRTMRELSLLSRKDGLTGLNNRRTFMHLAHKRMQDQQGGVLLLLDADFFKRINDQWGHAVGDICLVEISHRLKWNLRGQDVAGRIGGEEFAVLLSGATIQQARVIAGRIGQPIPFRANADAAHLTVTLSMGAVLIEHGLSLDAHLLRADEALYLAKERGRSRLVTWQPPPEATDCDVA